MRYWLRNCPASAASRNTSGQVEKVRDTEDDKASEADLQAYEVVQGEAGGGDVEGGEEK